MNSINDIAQLANRHCAKFETLYPRAFSSLDDLRRRTLASNPNAWPPACYAPIAAAMALMNNAYGVGALQSVLEAPCLSAMAAWRTGGKHVVVFDPNVLETLWRTPVRGNVPTDVLLRLPFMGVYVPLGQNLTDAATTNGVFIHLEYDTEKRRHELRFAVDLSDAAGGFGLVPLPLDLNIVGTVEDTIEATLGLHRLAQHPTWSRSEVASTTDLFFRILTPLVSVALYLCADETDIRRPNSDARPTLPPAPAKGRRLFAPSTPTVWAAGVRVGAALRRAGEAVAAAQAAGVASTGRTVRPHMRAAHWHAFRVGPRDAPRPQWVTHWLPPLPINMPTDTDPAAWADLLPITIRPTDEPA